MGELQRFGRFLGRLAGSPAVVAIRRGAEAGARKAFEDMMIRAVEQTFQRLVEKRDMKAFARKVLIELALIREAQQLGRHEAAAGSVARLEKELREVLDG